eukprot:10747735-Alexandrium_andersonii.AAC.1
MQGSKQANEQARKQAKAIPSSFLQARSSSNSFKQCQALSCCSRAARTPRAARLRLLRAARTPRATRTRRGEQPEAALRALLA